MKLLGMGMVLVCCWMSGNYLACGLAKRVMALEGAIRLVSQMHDRMRYLSPSLGQLLEHLCESFAQFAFLEPCRQRFLAGERFRSCWKEALARCRGDLTAEDAAVLGELGDILGAADLGSQLTAITYTKNLLENRLESARERQKQHGKLYRTLGALAGVAAVIVLA